MATEIEIAWAAGLFEGEGYIVFPKGNSVKLGLEMTDEDVVRKFRNIVACGTFTGPKQRPNRKPIWTWYINERDQVRNLIERFIPHLGRRRLEKALAAIERLDKNIKLKKAECGTPSGARRHYALGEKPCDPCRLIWNKTKLVEYHARQQLKRVDPEWVDHDAPANGIGPACISCHNLIDSHPQDHKLGCPWL